MTKNRWIFYAIFAAFHLASFIFTVVIDNNSSLLFKMVGWVPSFKWVTLLGLILLIVDILWSRMERKDADKEKSALNHELQTLKAKLFDMQEDSRKRDITRPGSTI